MYVYSDVARSFTWRIEWHSVVFCDESSFCLHANDCHFHMQHRLGDRHLPTCICPWHIHPTTAQMMCATISCNSRILSLFVNGRWPVSCMPRIFVNLLCCHSWYRMAIYYPMMIMPTHVLPVLYNMLWKVFGNFPIEHDGTWWEHVWHVQFAHLQLLFYCINGYKWYRIVFTTCKTICMQV